MRIRKKEQLKHQRGFRAMANVIVTFPILLIQMLINVDAKKSLCLATIMLNNDNVEHFNSLNS